VAAPKTSAPSKANMPPSKRQTLAKKGQAVPDKKSGGRFPITNAADLKRAIAAIGRAKPEDKDKIKNYIRRRAKELGLTNMIPSSW
jgi:hypothetical protein